jgi:phosphoenolpyruvate synthase/pyruvate phosphate dikinase
MRYGPVPEGAPAFAEGNKDLKDLLGGTGANLAEMTNVGLPVPAYGDYLANAQGEDVMASIRNTLPLTELEPLDPVSYRRLR